MKRITLSVIFSLFIFSSFAQIRPVVGLGLDIYGSKYIWDDDTAAIDLKDFHSLAFNFAPHFNVGVDFNSRARLLAGIAFTTKCDKVDATFSNTATSPMELKYTNHYTTIPISFTFNCLNKTSKSRLPIGLTADFSFFKNVVISSDDVQVYKGESLPHTYKYEDLKTSYNKSIMNYGLTLGYGYQINDNLGIDALLFAKYDASDFSTDYDLYDRYAFAGINISVLYQIGKKK